MKNFSISTLISELREKTVIESSDVHHLITTYEHPIAQLALVELVYIRNHAYCYTVAHNLGVHHHHFEDRYHDFIQCKVCGADFEILEKMVTSIAYTGTAFRHHLISAHRKKKVEVHGDESHAAHLHGHDHHLEFDQEDEVEHYCQLIRHRFQKGDLYESVFRLHLKGHSNEEINKALDIQSAHTAKHRIIDFLRKHRQQQ